jgi:anthranilate phosphoribosyltransferase
MSDLKPLLAKVADGKSLSREEARDRFQCADVGRGDAVADRRPADGIAGARRDGGRDHRCRRNHAREDAARGRPGRCHRHRWHGGDASGSYNISTCAAFVAAGAGLTVAKHGNRALSSKSVSADVLMALGVKLDTGPEKISRLHPRGGSGLHVRTAAPFLHEACGPTRVELGTRTIFNLLGPLSNPAG